MENIFENWAETKAALLEGLSPAKQAVVAPLLENQKNQLLSETAASGSISATDIAGFRKILIPMIRRIIPGTIATELVGVQPMSGPVGLVYTLRYRYAEVVNAPSRAGANPFGLPGAIAQGDEVFGNTSPIRSWYSSGLTPPTPQSPGASGIVDAGDTGTGFANDIGVPTGTPGPGSGDAWMSETAAAWSTTNTTSFGLDHGFGPYGPDAIGNTVAGSLYGGSGSDLEGSGGRKMTLDIVARLLKLVHVSYRQDGQSKQCKT